MFLALGRLPMAGVSGSDRGSRTGVRSDSHSVSDAASGKEALWQERIRRFRRSGQTVAGFCAAEGVSTASFYQWRRRLAQRRPTRSDAASRRTASSRRGVVSTSGRRASVRDGEVPSDVAGRTSAFQTVRVRAVVSAISVHLPGGARIDVPAEQLDALRAVVEEICRWPLAASGERSSC